jgi:adenylylsulfate kinase
VIWFTGLSGSGKSTVANTLDHLLAGYGCTARCWTATTCATASTPARACCATPMARLCGALRSRVHGHRPGGEHPPHRCRCAALLPGGLIALTAFISPYRIDRDRIRADHGPGEFIEVFVDTPLDICEERDPKGLYKKARAGEIKHFTGIDDPYEAPDAPELTLLAGERTPEELAHEVIDYLVERQIIPAPTQR